MHWFIVLAPVAVLFIVFQYKAADFLAGIMFSKKAQHEV